jgi:hypothetical protein
MNARGIITFNAEHTCVLDAKSVALAMAVFPEPDAPVMMTNGITSSPF